MAQAVKKLPATQETWVPISDWDYTCEGNDNPLQYSCLENPMDREAWQATVHNVAKESDMTATKQRHMRLGEIFHCIFINFHPYNFHYIFFTIFSLNTILTRKNKIQSIRDDMSNAFKKYLK